MQPFQGKRASRIATSFVFFWAAGLGFLWWIVTPIYQAMKSKTKLKAASETTILIALGLWLLVTLAASMAAGVVQFSRVPGAAYGALVWICAGILFHALRKLTPEQNNYFIRGLIFIGSIQGLLTSAAVTLHPSPLSKFNLLASPVIGDSSGIGTWATSNLAYVDYFGGGIVRSAGMMATAAWSGGYACLVLILLLIGGRKLRAAGMSNLTWLAAVALNAASLYFSYSRVSIAILVLIVAAYALYRILSVIDSGGLLATVTVIIGAVFMFTLSPWQSYILEQDSLRPGSSGARFLSYDEGFSAASESGPLVFIAGNGVKPFLEEIGRGAGSESTYMSLLVRGGLIAVVLFLCFLMTRLSRAWKARDWTGALLFLALAIHALVEDLDIGTLTLLLILIEPARVALSTKPELAPAVDLSPAYRNMAEQAGDNVTLPGR
ncbi:O-antigen ligase family protein [Pseudarthrobacter sp. S6]|uniref:O-antigen ligase family protein n=1 Tax=Pseudarthrobacter sp. S6 TaxID=3418420 RepID=UPI003CF58535